MTPCVTREPSMIRLIGKLFEPALDSKRAGRVYHEFDELKGYRSYHQFCRSRFTRRSSTVEPRLLTDFGFQYVDIMRELPARQVLKQVVAGSSPSYLKKGTHDLEGYAIEDPGRVEKLLEAALPESVDALICGFFQSEYLVHWYTVSRTMPARQQRSVSFRWHCDRGPTGHLKILVYLNDAREHRGGTAFLNLEDTARLAERGYLFGRTARRSSSIEYLSRLAGYALKPDLREVRAGQGIIFRPACVLHSGISPTLGPRYVLTLCLLPSPVHWWEAFRLGTMSDLAAADKWHQHASALLEQMGITTSDPRALTVGQ